MAKDLLFYTADILAPSLHSYWEGAVLEKVKVNQQQSMWQLHITVAHPLKREIIIKTEESLLNRFPFLKDLRIFTKPQDFSVVLRQILHLHSKELKNTFFSGIAADDNQIKWNIKDDRLDLVVTAKGIYDYIIDQQICSKLTQWIWDAYMMRTVVRVIFVNSDYHDEVINTRFITRKKVEVLKTSSINNIPKTRKSTNSRRRNNSSKLNDAEIMKISELEEGLKVAVVEGEVWYKEINILRDGRCAIGWSLTDFTDSIIVKSFQDKAEDDQVNEGDWVRVCGSVRFDKFAGESVLFMDSYIKINKEKRSDNAERKRIELHAHTKMSAMDGLTEIKALVKRAAEWGHSAIAITDHGCIQAFPDVYHAANDYGLKIIYGVEGYLIEDNKKERPYHIIILVQNMIGLKNLYNLISKSYLEHYYRYPKISRQDLINNRNGLLLGSACEAGELYRAIINKADQETIESIANFYDYLEIQPTGNNEFLLRDGTVKDIAELQNINKYIVELGKKLGKPVVATGDVHFLDPHHEVFRRIIQAGQGFEDAEGQAPLYFKTTDEMLEEFGYLENDAEEVVINNPAKINEMIEKIKPVPDGFFPPQIDGAEDEILKLTWDKAYEIYGNKLPPVVEERIKKELDAIIRHGFSVLYLIAHKLVNKSNQDGYLVGSRGSVGSSLVAYFTGITEVNPLVPHYLCPACKHTEFFFNGSIACGADLEDKTCPHCDTNMIKDGFDIPFETFLGFEGDKVPDIDLNFSGDYQGQAHQYVEELFGQENVFRAGTISTIAEKTAYGFVKKYVDDQNLHLRKPEINRLVKGITGVRRTTGQHPGGLIVVPRDRNIHEFTPLQHPAEKKDSGVITTHFEYHAIGDQLVKLDILGHDDPTVIKALEDLTGTKSSSISLSDKETMRIFSGVEPLGIKEEDIGSSVGTFGIPEFGTRFVRQMLEDTRPTKFSELVRISGLSHGTDVWLNNAQVLIKNNTATLNDVICTRDDIMTYLIQKGINKKQAFKIMENVRKGKGLTGEQVELMQTNKVPNWYISSCRKIKYMFPKAHAAAYVTMAFRIAYYKVNYPLAFYASFFSIRAEDFDYDTIIQGYDAIRQRIEYIEKLGINALQKDKKLLPILEVALEMCIRGFKFYPVDIYQSDAEKFIIYDNGLLIPFSSLPNIGVSAAYGIVEARKERDFTSIEDFQVRSRLNKTAIEVLKGQNCFNGWAETSQISLFG